MSLEMWWTVRRQGQGSPGEGPQAIGVSRPSWTSPCSGGQSATHPAFGPEGGDPVGSSPPAGAAGSSRTAAPSPKGEGAGFQHVTVVWCRGSEIHKLSRQDEWVGAGV